MGWRGRDAVVISPLMYFLPFFFCLSCVRQGLIVLALLELKAVASLCQRGLRIDSFYILPVRTVQKRMRLQKGNTLVKT